MTLPGRRDEADAIELRPHTCGGIKDPGIIVVVLAVSAAEPSRSRQLKRTKTVWYDSRDLQYDLFIVSHTDMTCPLRRLGGPFRWLHKLPSCFSSN